MLLWKIDGWQSLQGAYTISLSAFASLPQQPRLLAHLFLLHVNRFKDYVRPPCREIENYSYLVKKYCLAEAGLDPQGQYLLETVRALSPLNDAQVRVSLSALLKHVFAQVCFFVVAPLCGCVNAINSLGWESNARILLCNIL